MWDMYLRKAGDFWRYIKKAGDFWRYIKKFQHYGFISSTEFKEEVHHLGG